MASSAEIIRAGINVVVQIAALELIEELNAKKRKQYHSTHHPSNFCSCTFHFFDSISIRFPDIAPGTL